MSLALQLRQKFLEKAIRFYAPFLGAGVRVKEMSKDFRFCKIEMPLTFYNRNYMGTQFGGSLYAMVDPWYMLMLIKNLGPKYIVWDKAANIRFKKPGRGTVWAEFKINDEIIKEIKDLVEEKTKIDYVFHVEIKDKEGNIIAEVDKILYIRKKT